MNISLCQNLSGLNTQGILESPEDSKNGGIQTTKASLDYTKVLNLWKTGKCSKKQLRNSNKCSLTIKLMKLHQRIVGCGTS